MRLPSIQEIRGKALDTFSRFPIVMLAALIGTVATILFIESDDTNYTMEVFFSWQKFILICSLSIPILISFSFYTMRKNIRYVFKVIIYIIIILSLTGYYFLFENREAYFIRYILFSIAAYLLVTYSAYINIKNEQGFWEFNKTLFLRLLNSILFSLLLYLGLTLAVSAIGALFNVKWHDKIYLDIFVCITGIFNTWYFLSGVPENYETMDNAIEYPKLMKLFSQYVLIPLSIVYLLILYAYTFKIIAQWQLPIGWTSSLILAYSGIGILAYLLLYPFRKDENNKWSQIFSNLFFKLLFPLIILMALAVIQRISDYGITEPRYFLIIITIWLFGIAIYYTFSKVKNIKIIPVSLMITAIIISFGPWGAFSISENSQINRIFNFLNQKQIIVNGKINKDIKLKNDNYEDLVSTLNYLEKTHKLNKLISKLESSTHTSFKIQNDSLQSKQLLKLLSIVNNKESEKSKNYKFELSTVKVTPVNIENYEYVIKFNKESFNNKRLIEFTIKNNKVKVYFERAKSKLIIFQADSVQDSIKYDLKDIIYDLASKDSSTLTSKDFEIISENKTMKILFIINKISGIKNDELLTGIGEINGDIYFKMK